MFSAVLILAVIALIFAVCSLVPNFPQTPLLAVAVILLAICVLIGAGVPRG